jgi:glycosyltransferase involved in cell wall biosynthesis
MSAPEGDAGDPRAPRAVDIVVPVYNEAASIDEFYARVRRTGLAEGLIFVDNASTDDTVARITGHPGVRLIRHASNQGYGASIRDGVAASDAELVVIIDADLEYPPEAIPELLVALRTHPVVYGSRFLGRRPPPMPFLRRAGNRIFSRLFRRLFGVHTTDLYTGMKGFRRAALPLERLRQNGFEHAAEMAVLIALSGLRIHEVPITYTLRRQGRSKMRHLPEALKLGAYIVRSWLRYVILKQPFPAPAARD